MVAEPSAGVVILERLHKMHLGAQGIEKRNFLVSWFVFVMWFPGGDDGIRPCMYSKSS